MGLPRQIAVCGLLFAAAADAGAAERRLLGPLKGWSAPRRSELFDRTSVWQAINGAAEIYLAYGMRSFEQREYRRGKGLQVTVQLLDMGAPLSAFGVFARERPPEAVAVEVPPALLNAAALVGKVQCLGLRGGRYLRAQAIAGELTAARCAELLGGLARKLPGTAGAPAELGWLPAKGQVAGSAGFALKSCFGLRELSRCVHARYRGAAGNKPHDVFVLLGAEGADATKTWGALQARWKRTKQEGLQLLSRDVPYKGVVAVVRTRDRRRTVGVASVADVKQAAARLVQVLAAVEAGKKR